jgi:hypothetical protein
MDQRLRHRAAPRLDRFPPLLELGQPTQNGAQHPAIIGAEIIAIELRGKYGARCTEQAQVVVGAPIRERARTDSVHTERMQGREPARS